MPFFVENPATGQQYALAAVQANLRVYLADPRDPASPIQADFLDPATGAVIYREDRTDPKAFHVRGKVVDGNGEVALASDVKGASLNAKASLTEGSKRLSYSI